MRALPALAFLLLALAACGDAPQPGPPAAGSPSAVPQPVPAGPSAYEVAGTQKLEERAPQDWPDLHNVFRLSENIVSGSEPHGEQALERIAAMGVKTILSVDGKAPDSEAAAKYGMRYVHVPIEYKGVSQDERMKIAKVFRELEGPFYVHCFHGKHRGPAAAAVGRVVLDGASRERALAEMRQYCGTSEKYPGLYETIARGALPAADDTASFPFDFPATVRFSGFREVMVEVSRAWDHLLAAATKSFEVDPEHPDLNAANEAQKLAQHLASARALPESASQPEDYRAWLGESADFAASLRDALVGLGAAPDDEARLVEAQAAMKEIKARCDACHSRYRNE